MPLDLVVAGDGLEQEFLARVVRVEVGGLRIPVISPEDLVVTKLSQDDRRISTTPPASASRKPTTSTSTTSVECWSPSTPRSTPAAAVARDFLPITPSSQQTSGRW